MATVYLAHDLRHDRRVALKVLRPELAAVIGAERFLAEIKLTANLQHPHILPLFDSGEADGCLFYVMPFVEGESLRDRLNREKQLPVAEAVRIATEVASALDYAHRHGVIHRDIKPENILLHDGQALVADFGIALAASKAGGSRMTETGMSLGTPHYMSPEQAMGEREITARSDVYALGAMLYEMLTGDPPFTGSTAQAIVARVLTEAPRPILPQRHTIPPHVEAAVLTALEKLPADRFATAAEFAEALGGRELRADRAIGGRGADSADGRGAAPRSRHPRARSRSWWSRPRRGAVGLAPAGQQPTVNRFSLFLPPERGAAAGDPVGKPGGDLARRKAAGVRGPGGAGRPALAPGARPAPLDADQRDRGRGLAVLLARRPPRRLSGQRREAPDRVARWRPRAHPQRQRELDRGRLGTGRLHLRRGGLGHRAPALVGRQPRDGLQHAEAAGGRRGVAGPSARCPGDRLPHPAAESGRGGFPDRGDEAPER